MMDFRGSFNDCFPCELTDGLSVESERQQDSSTVQDFLSILAELNNVVIWTVSARPLISNSSSSFGVRCKRVIIHGTHVTINKCTNNEFVYILVSDLKIEYYNNN